MKNKKYIKLLEDTIQDLKNNPEACTEYIGDSQEFVAHESEPGKQLSEFIKYLSKEHLIDKNYLENYKKIKNKKIEEYNHDEIFTALSKIIMGERFITGELYYRVKSGLMLNLLERLYSLVK